MKVCSKCGAAKDEDAFRMQRANGHTYRRAECRTCESAARKAWYARNRDAHRARVVAYFRERPEVRREAARRWRAKHRTADYYKTLTRNPEKHRARAREAVRRRRARLAGASVGRFTEGDWQAILAAYGNRCAYCGRDDVPLTRDHRVPVSRGGAHDASNIVPACQSCNSRKGARLDVAP